MDSVQAVGQLLSLSKAVLVADQVIPLGFCGGIIAAGGLQVDTELGTSFRSLKLGITIVAVLDDSDGTLLDGFLNGQRNGVQLHRVILCLCAHRINGGFQQVALGGSDFPDGPVIAADIVAGGELAVGIGGIGVDQLIALVNAILCAGQRAVALGGAGGSIGLGYGHIPLLQDVGKVLLGDGVPLDGSGLAVGDDILGSGVHLFQGVAGADQHILKISDAIAVGDRIFINGVAAEGSAIQMEGNALVQTILGGLGHGEMAPSEGVAEGHGGRLTVDHVDVLGFLVIVLVIGLLGYHILTGNQIVDLDLAVGIGGHSLVNALTGDAEGDALHNTILGGLDDLHAPKADIQLQIALHRVADRLGIGDEILRAALRTEAAVRPGDKAHTHGVFLGGRDGDSLGRSLLCGDTEGVAIHHELDTGDIGSEGVAIQNTVGIGQLCLVLTAGPCHLDLLGLAGTLGKKAGQLGVLLHIGFDGIVVGVDALIQGMCGGDALGNGIVFAGINLSEIAVTLTHDGFPNQQLGGHCLGQLVTALVLGTPVHGDRAGVAILEDTTDEGLDLVAGQRCVQLLREVVPEVLVPAGKGVAGVLDDTGFDAIADIAVIFFHRPDVGMAALLGDPAVHVVHFGMAPALIVGFAISGERDHADLGLLTNGLDQRDTAEAGHQAQHQGQHHGRASQKDVLVHVDSPCL